MQDISSSLIVTVAHDYQCPWCWIAWLQAEKLSKEFPQLHFAWDSYELLPTAIRSPEARPQPSERFKKLAQNEDAFPKAWPDVVSSHSALEGAEYMKMHAPEKFDDYNSAVYRSFWEKGEDISDIELLASIAGELGANTHDFHQAISEKRFANLITPFKEPAYAKGITHVTTFTFHGEQCAEAPYSTIREMATRFLAWYGN